MGINIIEKPATRIHGDNLDLNRVRRYCYTWCATNPGKSTTITLTATEWEKDIHYSATVEIFANKHGKWDDSSRIEFTDAVCRSTGLGSDAYEYIWTVRQEGVK